MDPGTRAQLDSLYDALPFRTYQMFGRLKLYMLSYKLISKCKFCSKLGEPEFRRNGLPLVFAGLFENVAAAAETKLAEVPRREIFRLNEVGNVSFHHKESRAHRPPTFTS